MYRDHVSGTAINLSLAMLVTSLPGVSPGALPAKVPELIASPALGLPNESQETRTICDTVLALPFIHVHVTDAACQSVPGVETFVARGGGQDHLFTGQKPESGQGYGDFAMLPVVIFSIHLSGDGQAVTDLVEGACSAKDGGHYWRSWYLVASQP
jgi:hypothetical protein